MKALPRFLHEREAPAAPLVTNPRPARPKLSVLAGSGWCCLASPAVAGAFLLRRARPVVVRRIGGGA